MKKFFPAIIVALILIIVLLVIVNKKKTPIETTQIAAADTIPPQPPILKYGLPVDSFMLQVGSIGKNEHLSTVLSKLGVSRRQIHFLAKKSKPIFDVRKIRRGNNWAAFFSRDSMVQLDYFVYEIDATDYVIYQLKDSLHITRGQKPIERKLKRAQGTIKSSLWNAMVENKTNPVLSNALSEIYAWTIDFFAIQKGDQFDVLYEENYVDSVSIGIGKIHVAKFTHMNEPYWSFAFKQNDSEGYFDQEGKSLKKAFLKSPLKFSRISSRFSYSRMHPVLRIRRPHLGIDYAAAIGTPVYSIGDGTVIAKAYQRRGGGRYVKIRHNSVYTTVYMHLHRYGKGIKTGARVKQGQVIGYVGKSGLATGPHLDFRVYRNGKAMDPLKVKAPPVEPVKKDLLPQFNALKDSLMLQLNRMQ
ncbi:M23 family metallopeptidase [Prolixibacteraceae bacterium JC049]|nr:M23 family metallopeptidase [Prolixibacteraceae bacterium JC049]